MSAENDEVFKESNSLSDTDIDIHDIKKNLLSELNDDSPEKQVKSSMPPPPAPGTAENTAEKMQVYLRIRPLKDEERYRGEDQVLYLEISVILVNSVGKQHLEV